MDSDHYAEFIHCFAPSQLRNEPKGLCAYARQSGNHDDQVKTHLRDKAEVGTFKRSQGVDHHRHLTGLEREGYFWFALELNLVARLLLERQVSAAINFRPSDDHANLFRATPEVEEILETYVKRLCRRM